MNVTETVHYYPQNDVKEHVVENGGDCWCEPTIAYKDGMDSQSVVKYFCHQCVGEQMEKRHKKFKVSKLYRATGWFWTL